MVCPGPTDPDLLTYVDAYASRQHGIVAKGIIAMDGKKAKAQTQSGIEINPIGGVTESKRILSNPRILPLKCKVAVGGTIAYTGIQGQDGHIQSNKQATGKGTGGNFKLLIRAAGIAYAHIRAQAGIAQHYRALQHRHPFQKGDVLLQAVLYTKAVQVDFTCIAKRSAGNET